MANNRIYVASSWKNGEQPELVKHLREFQYEVYDFRHPTPTDNGFSWDQIDPNWQNWKPYEYTAHLKTHPKAALGYRLDIGALDWCDICILLLPCGRSSHLEAGYAAGRGKYVIVQLNEKEFQPELMYLMCSTFTFSLADTIGAVRLFGH